jgi:hypothetical protein
MDEWDDPYNASALEKYARESKKMFMHAYNSYMAHGFPADNVRPMSCTPSNVQARLSAPCAPLA